MEENPGVPAVTSPAPPREICPVCHQLVLPSEYFCPNCGAKLHAPPLSTTLFTQAWIYCFSIVLPIMCFLFVTKWPGLTYYRSQDPKAKSIGTVAFALIIVSTLVTCWLAYVWTEDAIQSSVSQLNAEMSP